MKRYNQANDKIRTPDALCDRVLAAPRAAAPRRAVILATAAALLITALAAGAALFRREDAPDTLLLPAFLCRPSMFCVTIARSLSCFSSS